MISDLEFKQEAMEEELEDSDLDQKMKHEDLQLEILKLEAALNMTITHWAELKTDHNDLADKTLGMLKNIIDMANNSSEETSGKDDNLDSIDVIDQETETTTPASNTSSSSPGSVQKFYNCTSVRKLGPEEITCSASSQFDRRFSCKKAFDGVLAIGRKNAWASRGEGVGSWIEAGFKRTMAVNQIKILQRLYPGEANKKIEIQFGVNGLKQLATLPAKGDKHWNIIKMSQSVVTDTIRITVKEVYGKVNNGFKEIQIFGCPYDA